MEWWQFVLTACSVGGLGIASWALTTLMGMSNRLVVFEEWAKHIDSRLTELNFVRLSFAKRLVAGNKVMRQLRQKINDLEAWKKKQEEANGDSNNTRRIG